MLLDNLELIVQYPHSIDGFLCRGFRGLRLATPAFVIFDGATLNDQPVANSLGVSFCYEVLRHAGIQEVQTMPCGSRGAISGCHALNEPSCRKILVCPLATGNISMSSSMLPPSAMQNWQADWDVVPVMPFGASVTRHLPGQWRGTNVSFWTRDPTESVWAIMQRAGLSPEESRIFISYVRAETSAVADQLFEALTYAGFDVFLDRCSVPVGVQFQERLMQDLVDKAMVVFLNSEGVQASHWVQEEIALVKKYRLGLLELRFPSGKQRADIDPDFTVKVTCAKNKKTLSKNMLRKIVTRIRETHSRALHRRRYELIDNFAAAMSKSGKAAQAFPDGTFLLNRASTSTEIVVSLIARPPDLGDFCLLHQRSGCSTTRQGWILSPAPFFLRHRQAQISWLGNVSNIQHANEAQLSELISKV